MKEIQNTLSISFLGNSIWQVALFCLLLIVAFVVARILSWLIRGTLTRWAERTDFEFDDIIIEVLTGPVIAGSFLIIAFLSLEVLSLADSIRGGIEVVYSVVITLLITHALAGLYETFLDRWLTPLAAKSASKLDDQLFPILIRGGKYTIYLLGIIIALSNAGYNIYSLLAGIGVGGIALAMAARETIAHAFGGVTIFTDRPFQIGDYIIVDAERGHEGVVDSIGLRTTRIKTRFETMLLIPNASITNNPIINVSSYDNRRRNSLKLILSIENSHASVQRARVMMGEILEAHEEIDKWKVYFQEFGKWGFEIKYRYWVSHYKQFYRVTGEINESILEAFEKENIKVAAAPDMI